jgi:hypothetical protein
MIEVCLYSSQRVGLAAGGNLKNVCPQPKLIYKKLLILRTNVDCYSPAETRAQ